MSSRKLQQELIEAYVDHHKLGTLVGVDREDEIKDLNLKNAVIRGLKQTLAMLGKYIRTEECRQDRGCMLADCTPVMTDGSFPDSMTLKKVGKMLEVDTDARGQFRTGVDRVIAATTAHACVKDEFSEGDVVICRGGHRGTLESLDLGNVQVGIHALTSAYIHTFTPTHTQILLEDGFKLTFKSKRAARLRHAPPKLRPPSRKTRSDTTPKQEHLHMHTHNI